MYSKQQNYQYCFPADIHVICQEAFLTTMAKYNYTGQPHFKPFAESKCQAKSKSEMSVSQF